MNHFRNKEMTKRPDIQVGYEKDYRTRYACMTCPIDNNLHDHINRIQIRSHIKDNGVPHTAVHAIEICDSCMAELIHGIVQLKIGPATANGTKFICMPEKRENARTDR